MKVCRRKVRTTNNLVVTSFQFRNDYFSIRNNRIKNTELIEIIFEFGQNRENSKIRDWKADD